MKRTSLPQTVNEKENTIIVTKDFLQKAKILNSPEHTKIRQLQADYPDYKIEHKTIKTNPTKKKHGGLTIEFMHDYIIQQPNSENVLLEFVKNIVLYKKHPSFYPTMKSWFLKKYPEERAEQKDNTVDSILKNSMAILEAANMDISKIKTVLNKKAEENKPDVVFEKVDNAEIFEEELA